MVGDNNEIERDRDRDSDGDGDGDVMCYPRLVFGTWREERSNGGVVKGAAARTVMYCTVSMYGTRLRSGVPREIAGDDVLTGRRIVDVASTVVDTGIFVTTNAAANVRLGRDRITHPQQDGGLHREGQPVTHVAGTTLVLIRQRIGTRLTHRPQRLLQRRDKPIQITVHALRQVDLA